MPPLDMPSVYIDIIFVSDRGCDKTLMSAVSIIEYFNNSIFNWREEIIYMEEGKIIL